MPLNRKIAYIDLSSGKIETKPINDKVFEIPTGYSLKD